MLRRTATVLAPRLLRVGAPHSVSALGDGSSRLMGATLGGALDPLHAFRPVTTSVRILDKGNDPAGTSRSSAAARRAEAEKGAAKEVQRWSSPLFSHVEVNVDDDRVIPRWANIMFVAAVVAVFGYCGNFAWNNENRKMRAKERARTEAEARAKSAIESGALRDHGRHNFASQADEADDPFEGMSPEEIEKLAAMQEELERKRL